jgi:hypothetical protein
MSEQQERGPAEKVSRSEEQEPITTADGAVRQLEKSALAERAEPSRAGGGNPGEVTSLGKAGGGAPEEDNADASEPVVSYDTDTR